MSQTVSMEDYLALMNRVTRLENTRGQQSGFGLNPLTNQPARRFRNRIHQGEYVQIVSSTTETEVYAVTFPPRAFSGSGRMAFVSMHGIITDSDASSEALTLRVKVDGTAFIVAPINATGLSNQIFTWDTRIIIPPDRAQQLMVSAFQAVATDGTLTTGRGSYAGPAAVLGNAGLAANTTTFFGDFAQPHTLSFTVELSASGNDFSFECYGALTELA